MEVCLVLSVCVGDNRVSLYLDRYTTSCARRINASRAGDGAYCIAAWQASSAWSIASCLDRAMPVLFSTSSEAYHASNIR